MTRHKETKLRHIINIDLVPRVPVDALGQKRKKGPGDEFMPAW